MADIVINSTEKPQGNKKKEKVNVTIAPAKQDKAKTPKKQPPRRNQVRRVKRALLTQEMRNMITGQKHRNEVLNFSQITRMTPSGFHWAMHYLDPATVSPPAGVPDYGTENAIVIKTNAQWTITDPFGTGSACDWCTCILSTPLVNFPYILITATSEADLTTALTNPRFLSQFAKYYSDQGTAGNLHWGEWIRFDGTNIKFNNTVYAMVIHNDCGGIATVSVIDDSTPWSRMRMLAKGTTVELVGREYDLSGKVVAGQVDAPMICQPPSMSLTGADDEIAVKVESDAKVMFTMPTQSQSELLRIDARAGTRPAKDGDYMVQRLRGGLLYPQFYGPSSVGWITFAREGLVPVANYTADENVFGTLISRQFGPIYDPNFNWGIMFLTGVARSQSFSIKQTGSIQVVPFAESQLASVTSDIVQPDPAALYFAQKATFALMHSFPADYNDFRLLLGKILGWAKKLMPFAGGAITTLYPAAAPAVATASRVIDALGPKD